MPHLELDKVTVPEVFCSYSTARHALCQPRFKTSDSSNVQYKFYMHINHFDPFTRRPMQADFSSRKDGCKAITLGKSITVEITDGGLVFGTTQPTLESRRDILMEQQKDTVAPTPYFCLCLFWDEELTHIDSLELLGFVADSFHDSFAEVTDLRLNYDYYLPQPTDWALHGMDLMKFPYPFKQLQHVDVANNSTFGFLLPYPDNPICTHRDLPSWYQPSPRASWSLNPLSSLRSFYFLDVDFMTLFSGPSNRTVHSLLIRYMKSRCSRYGKTSGLTGRGLIRKINKIYLHNCTGLSNLAWGQLGFYGACVETLDPAGSSTGN
ncbi:hypothetical protein BDZ97DRAFT_1923823 [Flammula alnicola]|nr:hypothetical protein BDZ97DRAFT_1923823 [Flammula alnicola]